MNKLKKIFGVLFILAIILTAMPQKVYAAGKYSISVGATSITVGKSVKLTIKTTNAAGKFTVTSSNPAVVKVSSSSTWVDGSSMDPKITLKGLKAGTATITITPVNVSDDEYKLLTNKKSIKITVKKASTTTTTDKKPTTTTTKSSDATLKSLTTTQDLDLVFSKDKTNYSVTVDKTVNSLGLKAVANDSKATVKIEGDKDFVVGENTVTITVTAENGTKKIYTVTVIKTATAEAPLVDLGVKGYELNKEFNPEELEYSVEAMGVDAVEVEYTTLRPTTKVEVIGHDNLKEGRNQIKVIAITDKGITTVYTINVNVSKAPAAVVEKNNTMWLIIIIILIALVLIESLYIMVQDKIVPVKDDEDEEEEKSKKTSTRRTQTTTKKTASKKAPVKKTATKKSEPAKKTTKNNK